MSSRPLRPDSSRQIMTTPAEHSTKLSMPNPSKATLPACPPAAPPKRQWYFTHGQALEAERPPDCDTRVIYAFGAEDAEL